MKRIKALIMDVDGVLTDGKIYMGNTGELFKAFNIKDGYAIHEILPKHGIKSVILTGRESSIVLNRAAELEVDIVLQGIKKKENEIHRIAKLLKLSTDELAYIGDDMADYEAMKLCGIKGCPADAVEQIKEICNYVASKKGGEGAVRELIEWIVRERNVGEDVK